MGIIIAVFLLISVIYALVVFFLINYFRKKIGQQSINSSNVSGVVPVYINILYNIDNDINDEISTIADISLNYSALLSGENKPEEKVINSKISVDYSTINFNQLLKVNV